jgi:pilus assembly protein CpaB
LSFAIVVGLIAAFLVFRWVGLGNSQSGPAVVIASNNIQPGSALDPALLKTVPWPGGVVPPESFADPQKLTGRIARQQIISGEPILESKLAPQDSRGGLSSTIQPGKRAITVRVNDVVGVAGFALPGSFVDILLSARDGGGQPFSKVVLSRVKVLAVAQETASDPNKPKVVNAVTLELTPEESEQLDLARTIGSLSLVLRNELDQADARSGGTRLSDIIGGAGSRGPQDASPAGAPRSAAGVEEIRGVKRAESQ